MAGVAVVGATLHPPPKQQHRDRNADHRTNDGIHDEHMRHVRLFQVVYPALRCRMKPDNCAEHGGQQKDAERFRHESRIEEPAPAQRG